MPDILRQPIRALSIAQGGTKDLSAEVVVSGKAGRQRRLDDRRRHDEATDVQALLARLGINRVHPGAWSGLHGLVECAPTARRSP